MLRPKRTLQVIGFYMIATKVGRVYETELPYDVRRLLAVIEAVISIDGIAAPLECVIGRGFLVRLLVAMLTPLALVLLPIAWAAVRRSDQADATHRWPAANRVMRHAAPLVLRILFLAYPIVTTIAFEAFPCHDFGDEVSVLQF